MALPGPSIYQKQMATRRRTGDITRLADQYQRNVQAMTSEYEQAFSQYQAQTKEKMAPYESQVAQYSEALKNYESQASAYNQRLSEYQKTLEDVLANPFEEIPQNRYQLTRLARYGTFVTIDGKMYSAGDGISEYDLPKGYYYDDEKKGLYTERKVSTFDEVAPTAPTAPTAPEIGEFDVAPFEARRGQLETEFKRELGERRSARQRAVSRGGARPLLQGAA